MDGTVSTNLIGENSFILRAYDDALTLAERARAYLGNVKIGQDASRKGGELDADQQIRVTAESLRISSRIMHALAWLMVRRAVIDSELTEEEAQSDDRRLAGQEVCLCDPIVDLSVLPPAFVDLLVESDRLYRRVMRLEAAINQQAPLNGAGEHLDELRTHLTHLR